jgi:hypothetical protein
MLVVFFFFFEGGFLLLLLFVALSSPDHAGPAADARGRNLLGGGLPSEAGDGAEAVQALALGGRVGHGLEGRQRLGLGDDGGGDDVLLAVQGVDAVGTGLDRGAGGAWGLVDVLAIDVDGVGDKGGAAMAAASVTLLKAEDLQLGLDLVEEALAHGCGGCERFEDAGSLGGKGVF